MKVSAIAAMGRNRVIGTGSGVPWDLPRDREHFRAYTAGKAMLLGRRTFEEMSGWFRDHRPIVLTSFPDRTADGAWGSARSVEEAVALARDAGEPELVVSGGASVYAAALPLVDEVHLTIVDLAPEGSARFPELAAEEWETTRSETFPADAENAVSMEILTLRRRRRG